MGWLKYPATEQLRGVFLTGFSDIKLLFSFFFFASSFEFISLILSDFTLSKAQAEADLAIASPILAPRPAADNQSVAGEMTNPAAVVSPPSDVASPGGKLIFVILFFPSPPRVCWKYWAAFFKLPLSHVPCWDAATFNSRQPSTPSRT
jgi:hypothetical protein